MNDIAIRVENLSKRYRIGEYVRYDKMWESFRNAVRAPFRRWGVKRQGTEAHSSGSSDSNPSYIWALKDVSFEVRPGEVIGIIGSNGAGKSTLLKILTHITTPTEGYAEIHGRVSALLEVGTGFHPELTGRENIYLNGAVLGMKRKEIDRKFDEIVDFSGVEKFIDTPVKRYSTGMRVRLAFSVAAHLEPDILLVDEVLAVGDAEFQKKCLGKMEDVSRGGRTVLFVSHNIGMISSLCPKTILLTEGRIEFMGPTQQAVNTYLANFGADITTNREWGFEEAPSGDIVKVKSVTITDRQGIEKPYFSTTEPIFVTIEYWILNDEVPINIGLWLFNEHGNLICLVGNYKETRFKRINKSALYRSKCIIPGNLLNSGKYSITVEACRNLSDVDIRIPHCAAFETVDDQRVRSAYSKSSGIIKPDFEWQTERLDNVEKMGVHDS